MKDKFYERSEIKQREYQDLLEKFNIVQKDVVAINEIKRDRDERIKALRDELDATTKHFEELSGANSALVVQYEHQKSQYESLKIDYDRLVDNLAVANKIRQEKEEALSKKLKDYSILSKQYEESIKKCESFAKDNDKYYTRLKDSEKECDELKLTKESVQKQSEIQRT